MSVRFFRFFLRPLISLLPSLKLNEVKRYLYKMMGYQLNKKVVISSSAKILGDMNVSIGESTFIGHETMIIGGRGGDIVIGANCDISSRVNIVSGTHKVDMQGLRSAGEGISKKIIIEDGVWIGYGAIIMPGIKIKYKAVVAAGSVVNKDVDSYTIVAGIPARVIKKWNPEQNNWE